MKKVNYYNYYSNILILKYINFVKAIGASIINHRREDRLSIQITTSQPFLHDGPTKDLTNKKRKIKLKMNDRL